MYDPIGPPMLIGPLIGLDAGGGPLGAAPLRADIGPDTLVARGGGWEALVFAVGRGGEPACRDCSVSARCEPLSGEKGAVGVAGREKPTRFGAAAEPESLGGIHVGVVELGRAVHAATRISKGRARQARGATQLAFRWRVPLAQNRLLPVPSPFSVDT